MSYERIIASILKESDELPVFTDSSIKSKMQRVINRYGGIYKDDNWKNIRDIQNELGKILSNLSVIESSYDNKRPNESKKWIMVGAFKTSKDKKRAVWVHMKASGAGSVQDPLSKYDIVAQVEVLSPNKVGSSKAKDYLESLGAL
jgi:hypothetical protein